jgi:hypothetical protein
LRWKTITIDQSGIFGEMENARARIARLCID